MNGPAGTRTQNRAIMRRVPWGRFLNTSEQFATLNYRQHPGHVDSDVWMCSGTWCPEPG
jgi:hypothetical protein